MASTQEAVIKLKRILLSWDYWSLYNSQASGLGAGLHLKELPNTFESPEVSHHLTSPPVAELLNQRIGMLPTLESAVRNNKRKEYEKMEEQ